MTQKETYSPITFCGRLIGFSDDVSGAIYPVYPEALEMLPRLIEYLRYMNNAYVRKG